MTLGEPTIPVHTQLPSCDFHQPFTKRHGLAGVGPSENPSVGLLYQDKMHTPCNQPSGQLPSCPPC